jgi:HD-like signal output (HDOD) protein
VVEFIKGLLSLAEERNWAEFIGALPGLDFGARLIRIHLNPSMVPDAFMSDEEKNAETEAKERARWFRAEAEGRLPVVNANEAIRRVEALTGCPVVDTSAAMFQMLANGHPSSLVPLMEKAESDPGLAAQILIAANRNRRRGERDEPAVDDLRLAMELLGELKLVSLGKGLVTIEERLLHALPFTWPRFWMFQIAVARMARQTCFYLEFGNLDSQAYIAGLLHDLGKILLAHLYPFGWQAIMLYARENGVSTANAEKKFIGCTARELADRFAKAQGLPDPYRHVMRWLESPEEAEGDKELVAIVALARDLCRRNRVGHDGDQAREPFPPLEDTAAWRVLGPRVFPSFKWEKFQAHIHSACQEVKRELHGWSEVPAA